MRLTHRRKALANIPAKTAFRASCAVMIAAGCVAATEGPASVKKQSMGLPGLLKLADTAFHQMVSANKITA
jgi:hypothetical protein